MAKMSLLKEAKIWHYRDNIILSDLPESGRHDAVFPLCHENLYFVDNFVIPENSTVLDLCTGSGIIALFMAKRARKVVAIDINPRAIEFAKLNAELNGVINKIKFKIGNLFDPVKGMKFDVITSNPPFEPTPSEYRNYLYSDGGKTGTSILREIIEHAPKHLFPDGSLQMISYLREDQSDILSILKDKFEELNISELGMISAETYNNYLSSRLSILNPDKHLIFSNKFPIKYLYIKAYRLRNEH